MLEDTGGKFRFNFDQVKVDIPPKKKLYIGSGSWVTPRNKFRIQSYTFWFKNQQIFKVLITHKFLGLKNVRKI